MKYVAGIILMSIVIALTSCTKERDNGAFSETVQKGSWKITEFFHVDRDETDPYIGYKITFTTLNTVSASGTNFYVGEWHMNEDGDLQLNFGSTYQFDRFNATWHIVNYNDQMIRMDIVGGTDYLVFEKI